MKRVKFLFIICFSLTLLGCVAVKKSIDNYEACRGDVACVQKMEDARQSTYTITKSATGPFFPSASEIVAMLVSNAVAFGVGVFHGKKKG